MFPGSIPSYTTPDPNKTLDQDNHTGRHTQEEADIIAIATKVGIDSSADVDSHDYKIAQLLTDVAAAQSDILTNAADILTQTGRIDDIIDGTQPLDAGVIAALQIAANAITTAKILDDNVTLQKLEAAVRTKLGYLSAPDTSWNTLTLQNSWVTYDATYGPCQYYKDALGIVHLRGLIKNGTTSTGTVIGNLPSGYRPSKNTILPGLCTGRTLWDYRIGTTGDITIGDLGAPSSGWISMTASFSTLS